MEAEAKTNGVYIMRLRPSEAKGIEASVFIACVVSSPVPFKRVQGDRGTMVSCLYSVVACNCASAYLFQWPRVVHIIVS